MSRLIALVLVSVVATDPAIEEPARFDQAGDPLPPGAVARIGTTRYRVRGWHQQVFLSPDGKIIYVNNRVSSTTVALDANTLKPIRTYAISGGPDDMDFAPDGKIWITRRFAEKLAVLDPVSGQYQTIDVGRSPHGIWLNPKAP